MQTFILPFLLLVTLLGGLWVHDVFYSLSGGKSGSSRIADNIRETIIPSKRDSHQFTYPSWPTSKSGPEVTFPPAGQKPHLMRTDQMVYEDGYDQEQGKPFVPPHPIRIVRENNTRTYIPDLILQEVTLENEALERWLDDGGTINRIIGKNKQVEHEKSYK